MGSLGVASWLSFDILCELWLRLGEQARNGCLVTRNWCIRTMIRVAGGLTCLSRFWPGTFFLLGVQSSFSEIMSTGESRALRRFAC